MTTTLGVQVTKEQLAALDWLAKNGFEVSIATTRTKPTTLPQFIRSLAEQAIQLRESGDLSEPANWTQEALSVDDIKTVWIERCRPYKWDRKNRMKLNECIEQPLRVEQMEKLFKILEILGFAYQESDVLKSRNDMKPVRAILRDCREIKANIRQAYKTENGQEIDLTETLTIAEGILNNYRVIGFNFFESKTITRN